MDRVGLEIISRLYRFGEVVAGSVEERRVVEVLRESLEPICDTLELEYVPVTTWSEETCFIEGNGFRIRCSAHPPTTSIDTEGPTSWVSVDDVFRGRVDAAGKIVIVTNVEDPDDVAEATAILSDLGAIAAVFVDSYEARRRVVVCRCAVPKYVSSSRAIPAVHVPKSAAATLNRAAKLRVYVEAKTRAGFGVNVIGDIHGSREELVYISAHHDHWFWGCIDDLVGVGAVVEIAHRLSRWSMRKSVRIAVFSAEEGLPENPTPFYWAVGSRMHVIRNWSSVGDRIELVLNIDVPYRRPRLAATGLEALGIARYLDSEVDSYEFIYDTFPFASLGIPTLTIENFENVLSSGIYHSTLDDLDKVEGRAYGECVDLALEIVRLVDSFGAHRFVDLGMLEVTKQLLNRGAIQSIAIRGVERCLSSSPSRDVVRVINSAIFGYAIDRNFLTRPGVREIGGVVPWGPDTVEIPTGMDIRGWRKAYEKALSILNSIYYVCRGS